MNTSTITEVESLLEADAKLLAKGDEADIKGHKVYFADLGSIFGYSALVFCDGRHIYYANDYELHHRGKSREELRNLYMRSLSFKLYTEEELAEPIGSYDEYKAKSYFLTNYYGMRRRNVSMFRIFSCREDERDYEKQVKKMLFNPVCYAYYEDAAFVEKCKKLFGELQRAKEESSKNYEYMKRAFVREMFNHEYSINWQADYDVLSTFGRINWHGDGSEALEKYFVELNFSEAQKRAYRDARAEYYAKCE